MKEPLSGLPPASSAKWHHRRWVDELGYLRVRSLANPHWHRDIPWLVRWLLRERPPVGDLLREHYDDAIAAARRYQHLTDRGSEDRTLVAAWDDVLTPIDAVLEHRHRVHLDRVQHAGASGGTGPMSAAAAEGSHAAERADPWETYSKGKLPAGWSYPVGRDRVREALLSAGALVDDLSFGAPSRSYREGDTAWVLLSVHHTSDAKGGYFVPRGSRVPTLWMTLGAVPAADRSAAAAGLLEQWLPRACQWAARAAHLGNVWSAGEHSWRVMTRKGGQVEVVED